MSEGDAALACMERFVDTLTGLGMEHACISPGSRSTPIALALARQPRVRVHVHLDERSSAFFALGLAKATGVPVAIACTSGTAAANLLPAVVEASMARVPLLLLTADRPPELRGVGANQTIDQLGLYDGFVRGSVDAAVPSAAPGAAKYWRATGRDAYAWALAWPPGPVHVNLPFREPLVPEGRGVELPGSRPAEPSIERVAEPRRRPHHDEVGHVVEALSGVERGVVLAGSLRHAAPRIVELASTLGWPLIAEPTSGLRVPGALAAGQFLLADEAFSSSHEPDVLLQVGAAPTSRAGLVLAARVDRLAIVDPDGLVADPNRRAALRVEADADELAGSLIERLRPTDHRTWPETWITADAVAASAVRAVLDPWDEPYEGRVARDLAALVPDGGTLVVSASMPIRDLDAYMLPRHGLRVLANRGASGIDGSVSTTLGVAATGVPTYALCGDLSFLYDAGSLLWSARRGADAVFVVPNNDGGAIFSFLAQRDLPEFEPIFATPHGLDLAMLAAAAGARHLLVERARNLVRDVARASDRGGVWIVEVPSDREGNVHRHRQVSAAVAAALRTIEPAS